jgi:hypothetical protein
MGNLTPRPSTVPGTRRQEREHFEQAELFKFLAGFTYLDPHFRFVHASLNGVYLTPRQRMKAKAAGMIAGVWDVLIPYPGGVYRTETADLFVKPDHWDYEYRAVGGLYVEMKIPPNRLTEEQEAFRADLQEHFAFVVATSWLTAARVITLYLGIENKTILEAVR